MDTKAIFITGGAGGMGLATGQLFAEAGWRVGLFDLDAAALAAAKATIGSEAVMTGVLDVTDPGAFSEGSSCSRLGAATEWISCLIMRGSRREGCSRRCLTPPFER